MLITLPFSRVMTSPVADLSWLGSKPATYNQELPTQRLSSTAQRLVSPPELTYPPMGDPLFSTVRSALDGMGTPQEAAGYGGFAVKWVSFVSGTHLAFPRV